MRARFFLSALTIAFLISLQGRAQEQPAQPRPSGDRAALSEEALVGKVLDREGVGSIKPVMRERWITAGENTALEPGDWLQTGTRGANALTVRLTNGAHLILGPGTLLEVTDSKRVRLTRGEVEVSVPENTKVEVSGPQKDVSIQVTGTQVLRARAEELAVLKEVPAWLTGYKNNICTEAMGSLLANVEGRNVPLTLGYHKVTVDIRDQIARTIVEESFINHTPGRLEGIFYFPLPQDASISGFAMWIGDKLVEADVVEKERAREIYETILRERRDPALLEWTGGNIFKARVFPIDREKRIRIIYTQVLPKNGNVYCYNYSLQSEMLRLHPLKKLQIDVKINSTEPIARVECPSHPCRIDTTAHSAHLEFEAEEYTPKRDFEVDITTEASRNNIILIPHRRANEGYFMLLVNAPEEKQKSNRPVLRDGEPLDFIIMADTSGSVAGAQRDAQLKFIEAFLSLLSVKDTFNLMTCDVTPLWVFGKATLNAPESREEALKFLERRRPLGWSDLDKAFAAASEPVGKNTHVIYVGDGIVTAGDADPVAFSKRLAQMYRGAGTFHSVAPGSSYESVVLKAIASLGGGSVRIIGGGTDPAQTAFNLLKEILCPVVKDLKVTFKGVAVAAVYPETLPNLPAGTQQVITGRYDPTGGDARCTVTVSATFDGKAVEYSEEAVLSGAESGNSFIPRLWARNHLDHLLAQGTSQQVIDRIIALSEDYNIITPYTSFLVLESDEDRARFNVQKRFRMRDAEEFFAEGRDKADFELAQNQMLKAKRWRMQLRTRLLEDLADMGRVITAILTPQPYYPEQARSHDSWWYRSRFGPEYSLRTSLAEGFEAAEWSGDIGYNYARAETLTEGDEIGALGKEVRAKGEEEWDREGYDEDLKREIFKTPRIELESEIIMSIPRGTSFVNLSDKNLDSTSWVDAYGIGDGEAGAKGSRWGRGRYPYYNYLNACFPQIPGRRPQYPAPDLPEEVAQLIKTLNRRETIAASPDGFKITVTSEYQNQRGQTTYQSKGEYFLAKDMWLTLSPHTPGYDFSIDWCCKNERVTLYAAWLLGRARDRCDGDETAWADPITGYFGNILQNYPKCVFQIKKIEETKVELTVRIPSNPKAVWVLVIDTAMSALIENRYLSDEKVTSSTVFGDFEKVGGVWWPKLITCKDKDGKVTGTTRVSVTYLPRREFEKTLYEIVAARREEAVILGKEPKSVADAKQAVKDGKAKMEEHWSLLLYFAANQQWEKARPHLEAVCKIAEGKWGLNPICMAFLVASRRNEELRDLMTKVVNQLASTSREGDYSCATQILSYSYNLNQGSERMELLKALKPVCERQKYVYDAMPRWDQEFLSCLQYMGNPDAVFAEQKEMADKYPFNAWLQTAYARALASRGGVEEAVAHLVAVEKKDSLWNEYEIQALRSCISEILFSAYRFEDLVDYVEKRLQKEPDKVYEDELDRYLSALIMVGKDDKAQKLIEDWLVSSRNEELKPGDAARLGAAIRHALGSGYNMYRYDSLAMHGQVLAETARYFIDHKTGRDFAGRILQHTNFTRTDEGRALQIELYKRLDSEVLTLPAEEIQALVSWLRRRDFKPESREKGWQEILEEIYSRWEKEDIAASKQILANTIVGYGQNELKLKYYRKTYADAKTPDERYAAARTLFTSLLGEKWSEAVQKELVTLLPEVARRESGDQKSGDANLEQSVRYIYDLATYLPQARTAAAVTAIAKVNEMPRRELRDAYLKLLKESRKETAQLLAELEKNPQLEAVRPYISIERIYLQVKIGVETGKLRADTIGLLAPILDSTAGKESEKTNICQSILAARCIATLAYLAVLEPDAKEGQNSLLSIIDESIARDNKLIDWKSAKYALLLALDHGDDLEVALRNWYGENKEFAKIRWGVQYAYILAERNQINEAVKVLEEIEQIDELACAEYRALADWYMVQNNHAKHLEAKIKSYQTLGEYRLSNVLNRERYKYDRSGKDVPPELDAEIPLMLITLFRKANQPSNYIWTLRSLYECTRDFRLLECMPESVVGQSAQRIYPLLKEFATIINSIWDEATVDRLHEHLVSTHEKAKTDTDRRALRLLEFVVKLRAARQAQGAEPHALAALEALKAGYKGEWAAGEPELMAQFLSSQGALQPPALAQEQLRQLQELRAGAPPETYVRLVIAGYLAQAQWANNLKEEAIMTLGGALEEFRQANDKLLPPSANTLLTTYCSYLRERHYFPSAEKELLQELKQNHNAQQIQWLKQELYRHYREAIFGNEEVSLGKGEPLYQAVRDRIIEELKSRTNENHAYALIQILCDIWNVCYKNLQFSGLGIDIKDFAHKVLPEVLSMYNWRNSNTTISPVADSLSSIAGPLPALEFLVVCAETEPKWLRLQSNNFWSYHSYRLGELRQRAGILESSLEQRLLAVVLRELREDLQTCCARGRDMYHVGWRWFWSEKKADFARTAKEVLNQYANSEQRVIYTSEYLYYGLGLCSDAIDALYDIYRRNILGIEGQYKLCCFLQDQNRYGESVPLLVKMIDSQPDRLGFYTMLMGAYFHTAQTDLLTKTLKKADSYFHETGMWNESVIADLGAACLGTKLYSECVSYYKEAIALRVKNAPDRGVGDGTLAAYYRNSAAAFSGLKMTSEAVDAVAGAIISWGSSTERQSELYQLEQILINAQDLDDYVAKLDAEVVRTGLENPIIRKALGKAYEAKNQLEKAAVQFRLAVESQPNDTDTHRSLVQVYDKLGRGEEATAQLLKSAELSGHDIQLCKGIGDRFARAGKLEYSERAYTNIVEMMPNESESHQSLAEIRQNQRRWDLAALHWRHVIRIRSKEPTGYLGLAKVLLRFGDRVEVKEILSHLLKSDWPSRFGDVRSQAQQIQEELERNK
jgi:hypothetical protein